MRTDDTKLHALISAANALVALGPNGLSGERRRILESLGEALTDLDAHDLVMAGLPASGFSNPCGNHGADVLDLDCPECEAMPLLEGEPSSAVDALLERMRRAVG